MQRGLIGSHESNDDLYIIRHIHMMGRLITYSAGTSPDGQAVGGLVEWPPFRDPPGHHMFGN